MTDLIQSSKESLETGDMKAAGFAVFGMNVLLALTEAEDRVIERSLEETNFHLLPDREPDRKLSQTIEASKLELSKEIRTLLDWIDGYQDAATSIEAGKLGTLIWRSGSDSRTTAHYVWVEISSDADTGYVLRAMGPISEARPYHFMLVDQDNRVLDADVLPDDGLITIQSASAPRLLFVRFESGAKPENNLNIELVKITPVKEEFDPTNPLLVSVGQPYVREISSQADVWLKFSVLSGERYQIETYDLSDNVDTVIDRYESAYSESLERDDDGGGGLSSKMEIEPDITGDVFIKISDLNNSRTGSFNFILKKLQ